MQPSSRRHPGLRRETLSGTLANDNWARLTDLLHLAHADGCGVPEGTLQPQGFGIFLRTQIKDSAKPLDTSNEGLQIAALQPYNMGPADPGQCLRLDEMYVKNATPGSNATVVFVGSLCVED